MTLMFRVRARWTGFTGAPGFTVLHFQDPTDADPGSGDLSPEGALAAATKVRAFFDAIRTLIPSTVTITVDPEVDVLEDSSGELKTSYSVAPPAPVIGSVVGAYSVATGAVINWRTNGVRKGRRIRGRSFIVPLAAAAFAATGQLGAASVTTIQNAATTLADPAGTTDLVVYARPTPKDDELGTPKVNDGALHAVTSANVPAMGAILTSRRD